jgi:hypothetical protein
MLAAVAGILLSDKPDPKPAVIAGVVALMSGVYAATGLYPDQLPLSAVFGKRQPPGPPKGKDD